MIKYTLAMLLVLSMVVGLSFSRSKDSVVRDTYYYYSIEPVMFDYWKNYVDENSVLNYGLTSFNGIVYPGVYVVKNSFFDDYPEWWYKNVYMLLDKNDKYWIPISNDNRKANAYVTTYFQFYADGKIIGVILLSFLYGYISHLLYNKYLRSKNNRDLALLLLYYYGLLFSYVRFQFSNPNYVLSILMLYYIFIKKDGDKNEEC